MGFEDLKTVRLPDVQKTSTEQKPSTAKTSLEEGTFTLESLSPLAKTALEKKLCVTCEQFVNKLRGRLVEMNRDPMYPDFGPVIQAYKFENIRRDEKKKDWPKGDLLCDALMVHIDKKFSRIQLSKELKKETSNA